MNGGLCFDTFGRVKNDDVEHWSLKHPEFGLLELFIGEPDALRRIDPDFPASEKKTEIEDRTEPEAEEVAEDAAGDEGASTSKDSDQSSNKLVQKFAKLEKDLDRT